MTDLTGGRAFPNDGSWANNVPEGGMSLRDYFAAHALMALVGPCKGDPSTVKLEGEYRGLAMRAYECADAMLKERNKTP